MPSTKNIIRQGIITIIILLIVFWLIYKLQPSRIYKINTNLGESRELYDKLFSENFEIYVIQNPPSSNFELIQLINNFNKKNNLEASITNFQSFYIETFKLNRFYKPKRIFGTNYSISIDNSDYFDLFLLHHTFRKSEILVNSNLKPNCPYYYFSNNGNCMGYYFPNGVVGNKDYKGDCKVEKSKN